MLSKLDSVLEVSVTVCVFVCLPHNYDITDSHASLGVSAHHNVSIIILST